MANCRQAVQMMSHSLDRPLTFLEKLSLRVHLLFCGPCKRFCRLVGWLHRALPSACWDAELSHKARERIRRALSADG